MRVLCISTDYPPPGAGGYELQCEACVAHLRRHGHEVIVLTGTGMAAERDPAVQRALPRFPVEPQAVPLRAAWRAERRSAAVLQEVLRSAPDVVCFWRMGELSMSLVERVCRAGLPAIGMVCDAWMVEGPRRDPWCEWRRAPRFDGGVEWLFVSAALRREVASAGIAVHHARLVPLGVDLELFRVAAERPWRNRLLYVGRLSPLKGVDVAIGALAHLPGAELDIVGAGPPAVERSLRSLAESLGVGSRVRFDGLRSRAEVAAVSSAVDALLFPARWQEPFGSAVLEALASGTPVVATASGGVAEYLEDERTALIVPPDDPAAVGAAVCRLRDDRDLRRRLRQAGRATAERYPAERTYERVRVALEAAGRGATR